MPFIDLLIERYPVNSKLQEEKYVDEFKLE